MSKRVILVTGKSGQLGQSLAKLVNDYPQYEFIFFGREQLDLSQPQSVKAVLERLKLDIIINCAAYTSVDKAEFELELADAINHQSVKQLAQYAKQYNIFLIHISTDYVFGGKNYKPYIETDFAEPQGVYGITKLKGEQAVQKISPKGCIIRTSWVFSEFGNNFVKTVLKLGRERNKLDIVCDQVGGPTYAGDLAKAIMVILTRTEEKKIEYLVKGSNQFEELTPIYHYSNEGVSSWYDFAKTIFEEVGVAGQVNPIESKDYPTIAKRPYYSLMNKAKIRETYDLFIPYWKESLRICLQILAQKEKINNDSKST